MVIRLKDHIDRCVSAAEGETIAKLILAAFATGEAVEVSFESFEVASSSFVNSAFIQLLETYSFAEIRAKLKFIHSNGPINDLIKRRFAFESQRPSVKAS
jgi:hypothetical protein